MREAELLPLDRMWSSGPSQGPPGDSRIKTLIVLMQDGVPLPPVTVHLGDDGRFSVCDGLNRVWASRAVGFSHIPALIIN